MVKLTLPTTFYPENRWRPEGTGKEPICGYTFRGETCSERGPHYCKPRADRAVAFFAEKLLHTKGPRKRTRFILTDWQELEVTRPIFGEVVYSEEWGQYVRRYRIVYLVMARKNGKSEYGAGLVLLLTIADDEDVAEVYGAAIDTKQAGKVFEPAQIMVALEPSLSQRLRHYKNTRRLYDEKTFSYYEVICSDPGGELGHGPHGFILDEVLTQPDGKLWDAMRTAEGTRLQPLFIAITTETDDASSFGAAMIDEAERIMYDPARAPHIFAWVRKLPRTEEELEQLRRHFKGHPDLPVSIDAFDERNWKWPNPGLDDFKSREALRAQALEAQNEPIKENAFRQFQLNQRVQQASRWMPMVLYRQSGGDVWPNPTWHREQLVGRKAYCGFDLASKLDLVSWCLVVPDEDGGCDVLWRFWLPEAAVAGLDKANQGRISQWARDGWITLCEGDVIEYDDVYAGVEEDAAAFKIVGGGCDRWSMAPVIQEIAKRTQLVADGALLIVDQGFKGMTPGMTNLMVLVRKAQFRHHHNPVADWCFDNVEARKAPYDPELIRPDKPDRQKTGKRIDAVPTAAMAVDAWKSRGPKEYRSAYEDRGLMVL